MRQRIPVSVFPVVAGALLPVALAQQDESSGAGTSNTTIIAVCVVAGIVLLLFVGGAVVVCVRKRRARKPIRNRHASNPYGRMEDPPFEAHQLSHPLAPPRGRVGGEQPSTMYNDLNSAITDIVGPDDPSKSPAAHPPKAQELPTTTLSRGTGTFGARGPLSPPNSAMLAGSSTGSVTDPSRGYHYRRREHSEQQSSISKPMVRKSVDDAPFPRPLVVKGPSYSTPAPASTAPSPPVSDTRPPVLQRLSYPPTSSSESSSPPERIMTPPGAKSRRKMPPVYDVTYAEEPEAFDTSDLIDNYADRAVYTEAQHAQPPVVAAMFPKKQSIVEPHPLLPTAEPVIYDKDYAQLERTRIVPAQPQTPVGAQTEAKAKPQVKIAQSGAAPVKKIAFSTNAPYEKARSQKKDDRAAFQAAMRREGKRSAKQAWEQFS